MASDRGPPKGGGDSGLAPNQQSGHSDSWVLAAIDSWLRSGRPKEDIVSKVMTSFGLEDLREAATLLYKGKWCQPQISIPNTTRPDYSRQLAVTVYAGLLSIQNQEQLKVHFWVSSEDIAKLPGVGPFPDTLAEPEVAARLTSVDNQLKLVMDKLAAAEGLKGTVASLARTVTELQEQLKEARQDQGGLQPGQETQQSWAEVTGGQRTGRVHALKQVVNGRRERSMSTKRGREVDGEELDARLQRRRRLANDELQQSRDLRVLHPAQPGSNLSQDLRKAAQGFQPWQGEDEFTVVKRRKGAIQRGCSSVEAEGGEKPPFSVFISGTSTATTEEIVKEKLQQCARAVAEEGGEENVKELNIVAVEHIKLNIPQGEAPRSKAWKVTVSPDCVSHMLKGAAYPAAWGWRKWHQGPRRDQARQKGIDTVDVGA